ncbi:MAG: hypothetical protein WCV81_02815 [Microgenomates group bacterium]|jgi:hypothetical protein
MKEIRDRNNLVYVSEDRFTEMYDPKSLGWNNFINFLMMLGLKRNRGFTDLIDAYSLYHQNKNGIMLHAHANHEQGEWVLGDGGETIKIQDWIESVDGKAASILLCCCNPRNDCVSAKESIVIHPNAEVRGINFILGTNLRLYVPGEGYLESNKDRIKSLTKELRGNI